MARMTMNAVDGFGSLRDIQRIATFGRQFGFEPQGELDLEPERMSKLKRLFSRDDDIHFDLEVFFTNAGLDRISSTSPLEARVTYVKKATELFEKIGFLADLPDQSIDKLCQLATDRLDHFRSMARTAGSERERHRGEVQRLSREMVQIAGHRLGDRALETLADADQLAERLPAVGTANPDWTQAFADLGKEAGFGMMPAVATLAELAGLDETLVHRFSAESASTRIVAADEGALEAPSLGL
jgi:hypothetical protein